MHLVNFPHNYSFGLMLEGVIVECKLSLLIYAYEIAEYIGNDFRRDHILHECC